MPQGLRRPTVRATERLGLATGGYTRLGAPLRHLTSRLLAQPSERRLLIVIGDGLISDEGYEGRYAWADAAHAVEEANDAGVSCTTSASDPPASIPFPMCSGPAARNASGASRSFPASLPTSIASWCAAMTDTYLLQRQRVQLFEQAFTAPPRDADGAHGLREDAARRAHGRCWTARRHDQLP